jgi:hypothetical protein
LAQDPTFFSEHWGDIASVVGVGISIVGFIITIINVRRSKNAAQRAEEAALEVRKAISQADVIMELSVVVTTMEEIKRLHRASEWPILLDRYAYLKRTLVSVRSSLMGLSEEYQAFLQSAIQHFSDIERRVERALAAKGTMPSISALNEIVSKQADNMNEILATIRQDIGVDHHGTTKDRVANPTSI